jgi:hypothetical protein
MMNLRDLGIITGKGVSVEKSSTSRNWKCKIRGLEVKEGGCLVGAYGTGQNKSEAMKDYAEQIQGQMIVIDSMQPGRKTFRLPEIISASVRDCRSKLQRCKKTSL